MKRFGSLGQQSVFPAACIGNQRQTKLLPTLIHIFAVVVTIGLAEMIGKNGSIGQRNPQFAI